MVKWGVYATGAVNQHSEVTILIDDGDVVEVPHISKLTVVAFNGK